MMIPSSQTQIPLVWALLATNPLFPIIIFLSPLTPLRPPTSPRSPTELSAANLPAISPRDWRLLQLVYYGRATPRARSMSVPLSLSVPRKPPSVPYDSHPERPGEPDCPYFLKTQKCKFGLNCKFNHPKDILDASGKTGALDLPERPSEPPCLFYMKTGKCKFGVSCKFHHPKDIQIPSTGQETGKVEQTSSIEKAGTSTVADVNAGIVPTVSPAPSYNYKGLPMHPGEADCPFYMKTGSCKYGANCRYNHPERNVINPPVAAIGHTIITSPVARLNTALVNPFASVFQDFHPRPAQALLGLALPIYPQRPGQTECEYYIKTGECKFGERCKFHHDLERFGPTKRQTEEQNVRLTLAGLPRREGAVHCPFYMKTGTCGYGATCRFDHPPPGEVMAALAAGNETSASTEKVTAEDENQSPK